MTITREEVPALYDPDVLVRVRDVLAQDIDVSYRFIGYDPMNDIGYVSLPWLLRKLCVVRDIDIAEVYIELWYWDKRSFRWNIHRTWR